MRRSAGHGLGRLNATHPSRRRQTRRLPATARPPGADELAKIIDFDQRRPSRAVLPSRRTDGGPAKIALPVKRVDLLLPLSQPSWQARIICMRRAYLFFLAFSGSASV